MVAPRGGSILPWDYLHFEREKLLNRYPRFENLGRGDSKPWQQNRRWCGLQVQDLRDEGSEQIRAEEMLAEEQRRGICSVTFCQLQLCSAYAVWCQQDLQNSCDECDAAGLACFVGTVSQTTRRHQNLPTALSIYIVYYIYLCGRINSPDSPEIHVDLRVFSPEREAKSHALRGGRQTKLNCVLSWRPCLRVDRAFLSRSNSSKNAA